MVSAAFIGEPEDHSFSRREPLRDYDDAVHVPQRWIGWSKLKVNNSSRAGFLIQRNDAWVYKTRREVMLICQVQVPLPGSQVGT